MEHPHAAIAMKRDSKSSREKKSMAKTSAILAEQARRILPTSEVTRCLFVVYSPEIAKTPIQTTITGVAI